ncbi:multidrug resistance ABC transporter, ATP-binding/permease components [Malaciobacter molluscorum LMG 25693]|uniref:Multidrug resistance ABC transporter, ATP-binding/permease components n=1 Tax=Malaciobacter molluscorum LMG 25693 TaxID=870501 RepID=A0AB33GSS8_9BACT|nr:ABC transporter ATP-binding protein [Malaciobacter molluscorum]AXX92764.1 multidrug resistance ABC transporter, ATP-binding/permease components [Malaciobacter molluscorum LMG 25693]
MENQISKILYPLLKQNKRGFFIIFLFSIIVSVGAALQPYIIQNIIDKALIKSNLDLLYIFVAISVLLTIVLIIVKSINDIFYTDFSMKILFSFRQKVFEKMFLHKKSFLNTFHSADLMTRLQVDLSELQRFFTDSFLAIFSTFLSLIVISIIIYSYNIKLMILILVFLPIEFFCIKPLYKHMHESTKDMREKTSNTSKFFVESLRYLTFLKTLGAQNYTIKGLDNVQNEYKKTVIKNKKLNIVFTQIPALISLLGKTIILLYGGYLTINRQLQVGELVAFLTYFGMILSPVHTILGIVNNIPKVKVSFNRVLQILPKEQETIFLNENSYDLNIKNLYFSYKNNIIFDELNLIIKQNEKVALLGKNGSGKSTLSNLLCAIDNPSKGEIILGSTNIVNKTVVNITDYIIKMEQVPVILDTTLKQNLTLGIDNILEDEIIKALKLVKMYSWYENLKDKLDTKLVESGENLSVGQRQRLALCRVVLLKPKIIILDEFTSSIDKDDTRWLFENLNKLFTNCTVIVITHQHDMLNYFDKVYKIANRNIVEIDK